MSEQNWQEVGSDFPATHDFKERPELVAFYLGQRSIEIDDAGEPTGKRSAVVHDFRDEAGTNLSAWGSFSLDSKLADIEAGQLVRVVYEGTESFTGNDNRPRTVKRFRVYAGASKLDAAQLEAAKADASTAQPAGTAPPAAGDDDIPF